MVEDRFYEPSGYRSIEDMTEEAYEKYLENMKDEEGTPMDYESFKDWYWRY